MDPNNEDLCCPICLIIYSEKEHTPRMMECGHTQCANCISAIMKTNKRCGECRTYIKTNDVRLLPINYVVLRYVDTSKKRQNNVGLKEFKKLEDKINIFSNEIDKCQEIYTFRITDLKDKIDKAIKQKNSLFALKVKQEPFMKRLPELKDKLERINIYMEKLDKRIDYYQRRIAILLSKIDKFTSIKNNQRKSRDQLKEQIKDLSNYSSLAELSNHIEKTKALINDYENKYICEAQQDITEEALYPLFENPAIYFIKHKKLFSSIMLHPSSRKVLMKSIQSSTKAILMDHSAKFIMFSDINPYATGAFICVESQELTEMLEIELYDNRRSQQFALLCSGLLGKSLVNTPFFNFNRRGLEGEHISAGKVDLTKVNGPSTFLPNLPQLDTEHTYIKSGDIVGVGLGDTVFQIYLEDWPPKFTDHCFGRLLTGRNFLQINALNGNSINITDCGLIFDFNKAVDVTKLSNGLITSF